jgi:ribonuclease-3
MDWAALEKKIKVKFRDKKNLEKAFTHRSYINENRQITSGHNERLEFLGDAVLELVTTEYLYNRFPDKTEGDLTAYRSSLVNTNALSKVASDLGFNNYLLLSKGESKDTGRARQYILANTFEAVVGSIFLDQGYKSAQDFIAMSIFPLLNDILEKDLWIDAKSHLQELVQEKIGVTPTYKTILEEGPDHDKYFTVSVFFGSEEISQGRGKSKQEAEQEAARKVLTEKNWI